MATATVISGLLPSSTTATNARASSWPLQGPLRSGRPGRPRLEPSAGAGEGGKGNSLYGRGCWRVGVRAALPDEERGRRRRGSDGSLVLGTSTERRPNDAVPLLQGPAAGRIREAIQEVEPSMSGYDTAWVAMVPSSNSAQSPQFPQCIVWILENQHSDGSWGPHRHPHLMKDTLSSTLACVIALKRWNLGEDHIDKGINFILSNLSFINDEKQRSPIGFNIIFPRMIGLARDMRLHLPVGQSDMDTMLHMREEELKRASRNSSRGAKAYLGYVAEGLDIFPEWEDLKNYQRKNGSLFDSPSTTAAALTHRWDAKCLEYLSSLLCKFGNAVPARYPLDSHAYLHMIDSLEGLGLDQHFGNEIRNILDHVYRQWQQNDEEITSNIATSAMAFRLLRMHGYEISSGFFTHELHEDFFYESLEGYLEDTKTVLELYKASQLKFPTEWCLEKLNSWTSNFLEKKISNSGMDGTLGELDYALKFPSFANLERLEHRRNITRLSIDNFRIILKTSYTLWNIDGKDHILGLAAEEFNNCQLMYQNELEGLKRWIEENRLDQLTFARQKLSYCYFSTAATLFPFEMSDARISWAKNGVLTTLVDDFFDVGASQEERINFIQLMERWEENYETDCCSEQVKILYSALRATVNELGAKASVVQKRNVTSHIIKIWLDLARSMMQEAEWLQMEIKPTKEQYLTNGYVSFALGPIILPALYFIGPELSPAIVEDQEYHQLFKLVSTCGRLLNDIQGFEREANEGKLNSVSLLMLEGNGSMSIDEVKEKIRSMIKCNREELLKLVIKGKGSLVPRACKDLFWKMSRILHFFYLGGDGFTSPTEMLNAVNDVIHEPLFTGPINFSIRQLKSCA